MATFTRVRLPLDRVMALQSEAESFQHLVSDLLREKINQLQTKPLGDRGGRGRRGAGAAAAEQGVREMRLERRWRNMDEATRLANELTGSLNKLSEGNKATHIENLRTAMRPYLENSDVVIVGKLVNAVFGHAMQSCRVQTLGSNMSGFESASRQTMLFAQLLTELRDQLVVSTVRQMLFERLDAENAVTAHGALLVFSAHLFNGGALAASDVKSIMDRLVTSLYTIGKDKAHAESVRATCSLLRSVIKVLHATPQMQQYVKQQRQRLQTLLADIKKDPTAWPGVEKISQFAIMDTIDGK